MSTPDDRSWYFATAARQRVGPLSIREMAEMWHRGEIVHSTLVWNPDYPGWFPADKIAAMLNEAAPTSHPPTAPPPLLQTTPESPLPSQELKPRKGSFIAPQVALLSVVWSLLAAGVSVGLTILEWPAWPGLIVFLLGTTLAILSTFVAYRKERYELHHGRLIYHQGGLVSDQTTELEVRNITCVKVKLPWLRYKLFRVGNVIVESAGTSRPMVMRAIHDPEAVYREMRDRMKRNGYDLSQRDLLHKESPAVAGIISECFGIIFAALMISLFALPTILAALRDSGAVINNAWLLTGLGLLVISFLAFIALRVLDLRLRTYQVFNDVVVYEEGFLTRENAFIPYENIADSNTKCSFFDRILNLFDVQISCQGSGSEIKFRRLRHGVLLSTAIERIVLEARRKPKASLRAIHHPTDQPLKKRSIRAEPDELPHAEMLTADLGMHAPRVLLPLMLLLPLFPIWILAMIQASIRQASTRYFIRMGSLRQTYRFLTVNEQEFAYDKITGMIVKRNLWDRLFNTMTIKFWSIGSGKPIEFAHIHRNHLDLSRLMRQVGIPATTSENRELKPTFTPLTWLRAHLYQLAAIPFIMAIIIGVASQTDPAVFYLIALPPLIVACQALHSWLYHRLQKLHFHPHHIEAIQGILATKHFHVRYKNVKRIMTTRYPGGSEGDLRIFVAGEEEIIQGTVQRKNQKPTLQQCSFITSMLPDISQNGQLLDDILTARVDPSPSANPAAPPEVLSSAKRSLGPSIFATLLLSLVLFPLILLLPITIPLAILRIKRWHYQLEQDRVVIRWGLVFPKETSVLLDRVDSIQQNQGPLNKLFKNGNVSIMTAGSSKPDLVIINCPQYLPLYNEIRRLTDA